MLTAWGLTERGISQRNRLVLEEADMSQPRVGPHIDVIQKQAIPNVSQRRVREDFSERFS
jgi:hypothetical protein